MSDKHLCPRRVAMLPKLYLNKDILKSNHSYTYVGPFSSVGNWKRQRRHLLKGKARGRGAGTAGPAEGADGTPLNQERPLL